MVCFLGQPALVLPVLLFLHPGEPGATPKQQAGNSDASTVVNCVASFACLTFLRFSDSQTDVSKAISVGVPCCQRKLGFDEINLC